MVSNKKKCPNCPQVMPCATQICKACGAEQPKKARLMKRLQALDIKKREWLGNLKKNHNEAAMRDEAIILLEKLHAMGYKPLLLLQKEGNKKTSKISCLTPRCNLDPLATQHLNKMIAFYELVCAGWKASEDTVFTLTLTPCDEQGSSGEAGPEIPSVEAEGLLREEAKQEGPSKEAEGLVEEVELEGPSVEAEGLVEEVGLEGSGVEAEQEAPGKEAEGLVEEVGLEGSGVEAEQEAPGKEAEGLVEEVGLEGSGVEAEQEAPGKEAEGLVEEVGLEGSGVETEQEAPGKDAEGLVEEAGDIPKKGSRGKRKRKSEAKMDTSNKTKKNCSYHTHLGVYPIRSAMKERVRKGQTELLIDWEPCAACGKQWTPTWEPKESFV
ncbi:cell growth-regulating nucleolar protein-like [Pseudorasbora parva]|uniref:cell growth-regulating nucleolar protein-like n=1 Tax=Pseudorasbora parva TaxID=51549 RepID=UPI00351EF6F8